jgi:uncharacterized protein (DUF983 family)
MTTTDPTLHVQWKGTEACLDLNCVYCGHNSHFDGYINYAVECPKCRTRFTVSTHVRLDIWMPGDPEPTLFDL